MKQGDKIDYVAMGADYRAAVLNNDLIGEKYGCSEAWVRKKAKEFGWTKELSVALRAKADQIVSVTEASKVYAEANDEQIIEINAKHNAAIQIEERNDVKNARSIVRKLFSECEITIDNIDLYQQIGEILRNEGDVNAKMDVLYKKAISLSSRIDNVEKLTRSFKTLVDLERRLYNIDDVQIPGTFGSGVNVNISFN